MLIAFYYLTLFYYLRALMPMLLTELLKHVGQTAGKFYLTQKIVINSKKISRYTQFSMVFQAEKLSRKKALVITQKKNPQCIGNQHKAWSYRIPGTQQCSIKCIALYSSGSCAEDISCPLDIFLST